MTVAMGGCADDGWWGNYVLLFYGAIVLSYSTCKTKEGLGPGLKVQ
jgi:hypothetical protein